MSTGRVEWISHPERFQEIAVAWNALAERQPTPFLLHDWIAPWWAAFGGGRRMSVCVVWRGDAVAAGLPLWRQGPTLRGMANDHTPVLHPMSLDERARAQVIAAALDVGHELDVPSLADDDGTLPALVEAATRRARLVLVEEEHTSPIVDTVGAYPDYRRTMRKRWGSLERRVRQLDAEHGARYRLVEDPADLELFLRRAFALEMRGWKGRAGTAIASSEDTLRFYRSVTHSFLVRGQLRVSALEVGGEIVASELGLLHRRRLFLLKSTYDEALRGLSPGLALHRAVIEECFRMELDAYELLGDETEWKRRFATSARTHHGFYCYRRLPLPVSRYAWRRHLRPFAREAYRRSAPLRRRAGSALRVLRARPR